MTNSTIAQSTETILNSTDVKIIQDIAEHIDLSWFEWSIKLAAAAIIILCFKEIIFSIYRYLMLRMDKHISIGVIIKFNHGVYGKIKDYNLRTISIETKEGIVKIPLSTWLSTYYTQITQHDINVKDLEQLDAIKEHNKTQDEKLTYLYKEICDLKTDFDSHKNNDSLIVENKS